ncbi:MAG TPA: CHAD domain-containing protein [Candidatus Acidoferrales bacterium]|nr:CHAD domain-containing protein [Candidatus Acidoferrales bacterium]
MKTASKSAGLRYWMLRVLEECDNVAADFSADPVHDLRVSLRRCRSMADGMMAMDPDRNWKEMKKAGKQLFQRLGALRDVQIMMEWIEKLGIKEEPRIPSPASKLAHPNPAAGQSNDFGAQINSPTQNLLRILRIRETEQKSEARAALEEFDRKQWKHWNRVLPGRASRIRSGSLLFKHLALERWTSARELHVRAMRNRSQIALHTLRIGIKRFRYIVENFLPEEHQLWGSDLKRMQDLLGEVHDLDVLWATALSCHIFPDEASRESWHARLLEERTKRVDEYRQRTTGPDSLWQVWRVGLPQGKQIQQIATKRMKLWARELDPDFAHAERVASLSLELYDGISSAGLLPPSPADSSEGANQSAADSRSSLYAAALLHDVGKAKGNKGHEKESFELIKKHGTPLGWSERAMRQAAIVARFHCGALPIRSHKLLRDLLPDEQKSVIRLSAVLRLANALDSSHTGHVRRVKIENVIHAKQRSNGLLRKPDRLGKNEALVISAEGYADRTPTAQTVAAERYLLETVLRRPVIIRPSSAVRRPPSGLR